MLDHAPGRDLMRVATATRWVYDFADGSREMRTLGGKGAGGRPPDGLADAVGEVLARLEERANGG